MNEPILANVGGVATTAATTDEQLPFYKRARPNAYRFRADDFENIPVVQHRFKPRPPYVPPPADEQVTDGGQAQRAGIQLGDSIASINDTDTGDMSLAEAHQRIEGADGEIKLGVKKFDDEEAGGEAKAQEVSLQRKPAAKLQADREGWISQPERKVWHPIVWQQPPPAIRADQPGQEPPHKRLIRNLHRFFRETENNPESRQRHIEDMLLALPTISKDS